MTDREETLVYHLNRDMEQILHNIVNAWNRNKDYKQRWNISPKEETFVNIKLAANVLELRVEGLRGGWRNGALDQREMNKFLAEMKSCLKKAESDLRKEFKKVSGKNFRWSKGETSADFGKVGLNSLYKFVAVKRAPISVEVDRQKHSEKGIDGPIPAKNDSEEWGLVDMLKLPTDWK